MTFTASECVVCIETSLPTGGIISGSGVLISGNEVLTASHVVASFLSTPGATLTVVVAPTSFSEGDLNGSMAAGIASFQTTSTSGVHSTGLTGDQISNNSPTLNAQDLAVINLGSGVNLTSTVGYVGLGEDSLLQVGTPVTVYGYPGEDQSGSAKATITQESGTVYMSEHATSNGYAYLQSTIGYKLEPGISGGPGLLSPLSGQSVVDTFSVNSGTNGNLWDYYPALTTTATAEIEYWQAQDNNSPAIQRLYHALLGRSGSASEIAFYSPLFVSEEQAAASANNVPYASSAQVFVGNSTIVNYFLNSPEFQSAHPNINNTDLVNLLYNNGLGRPAGSSELSYYVNLLNAHTYTQAQIVGFITGSPEAIAHAGAWGQTGVLI